MRSLAERISPVLLASVVAGGFVIMSAMPATAEGADERLDRLHAERPIAAPPSTEVTLPIEVVDLNAAAAYTASLDAFYAGVAAAEAAEAAATARATAPRTSSGTSVSSGSSGGCGGDVDCFLACTRAHESDTAGGYGAVSSGGAYRGAYQFSQTTWDAAAAGAGHAEYAGVPADQAPPEVQDAAAAHLYSVSGTRHWGGRC